MNNIKSTLIDLVTKNFELNKKRNRIQNNIKRNKKRSIIVSNSKFSISSNIINMAFKEIEDKNKEEKSEEDLEETAEEESEDKRKLTQNGGYGTIKNYSGISTYVKYTDYSKIWNHIGTFRSQSMYENPMEGFFPQSDSKSTGILLDNKVIEKAERHFKYFFTGEVIGDVGYVPPVGANINSKDWEKYRMMTQMSIYRPLIALFRAIV